MLSDAATAWWERWRRPLSRFGELCYRLFLIVGYSWVGIHLELPIIADYLPLKNVLICLVAILLIGKTLFDSLFYDHYRP